MTDFKAIKGFTVQSIATDPVPSAAGSWASGGNLNTTRAGIRGAGTQTAGLAFGGETATATTADTEEYNGTAWSEQNNLNTARTLGGTAQNAVQTAALAFGGSIPPDTADTEEYNGTSWSEQNNLNVTGAGQGGAGIQTAALSFGNTAGGKNQTEEYDGTSWTAQNTLNTARGLM